MSVDSVWMTAKTAAAYLDFTDCKEPVEAFRVWAKRNGVATARRGTRKPLYLKTDLDRAIGAAHRKTA